MMRPFSRRWIDGAFLFQAGLFSLVLAACTAAPPQPEPDPMIAQSEQWREQMYIWQLKGRVLTPEQRASLRWKQNGDDFDLLLRGPFGFGGVKITGSPARVLIDDGESQQVSLDPVTDIYSRTGLYVPLDALNFWMRGVPSPTEPVAAEQRDEFGFLRQFDQGGWTVLLDDYQRVTGVYFPFWLRLEQGERFLQITVSDWSYE